MTLRNGDTVVLHGTEMVAGIDFGQHYTVVDPQDYSFPEAEFMRIWESMTQPPTQPPTEEDLIREALRPDDDGEYTRFVERAIHEMLARSRAL